MWINKMLYVINDVINFPTANTNWYISTQPNCQNKSLKDAIDLSDGFFHS